MEMKVRTVGIVARYDRKKAIHLVEDLARRLKEEGLEVCVEDTLSEKAKIKEPAVPLGEMKTDFIITIGGDGTILRTCLTIPKPEPPILAINMGVRGFLTEVQPKKALEAVERVLVGEYKIEKCMKLSVTAEDMRFPDALNEVVISTDDRAKLIYARIAGDGQFVSKCQADGLIAATQTGSTGYSLSAGGSVLHPYVSAFVLTPICPFNVFRPMVFAANSKLTIQIERPKKILVLIDGHHRQIMDSAKLSLDVTGSKDSTSFIRFTEDFYHRLRSRLLFKIAR